MAVITLEGAVRRLDGAFVYLEPEEVAARKLSEGKGVELWYFDPATGRIARGDGKFFDIRMVDRGGWGQIVLYEEPNVPQSADPTMPRIVGHVVIETTRRYGALLVRVHKATGLNGGILELKPSSISKGELAERGLEPVGYFEASPQRIMGMIAVYLMETDFPEEEGRTVLQFFKHSTDGRSLAALAKAGL
ncbi:MAG: hypothetical protein WC348_00135 [Patescibacteria group bacterium]|jgi:hypothetical protein